MSFRDAGFTPARAWQWCRRGFTAAAAEKWRDAGVTVAVAERWVNSGFGDPDTATPWIEAGATPAEAALYLRTCPDVDDAIEWRDRGFDPGSIPGWVAAGFTPDDAPEWAARWIQPVDAESWRAAGFCAVEAFMWRAQRIEPAAARAFAVRGLANPLTAIALSGEQSEQLPANHTAVLVFQIDRATAQVLTFTSAAEICASGPGKTRHSCPLSSHRTRYGGPPSGP